MKKGPRHIAPVVTQLQRYFRITHPFHPNSGEEYALVSYRRAYGHQSVDGQGASGQVITVPLSWTDAWPEADPFLVLAAGRSCFRVDDLLRLATLIEELQSGPRPGVGSSRPSVNEIPSRS
jgi:hypothetical protein